MLRRAALASILLLLLSTASAAADTTIHITTLAFPANTSIGLGDTVQWSNESGVLHSVTSDAPFSLWAFDVPDGMSRSRLFNRSGSYPYHCRIHGNMHGNVHVPINASPGSGSTATTFTITVATVLAGTRFDYVIQRKAPGGSFAPWKTINSKSTTFKAPRAGTWQFRMRLKKSANGTHSGWSPVLSIPVSG